MLTVDVLHEWDLGIIPDVYGYLIKVLEYRGRSSVQAFNERSVSNLTCKRLLTPYIEYD